MWIEYRICLENEGPEKSFSLVRHRRYAYKTWALRRAVKLSRNPDTRLVEVVQDFYHRNEWDIVLDKTVFVACVIDGFITYADGSTQEGAEV